MDSFVTQTIDSSVGQIEGQVCSKPFWGKTCQRSWAELVFEGCEFGGLTTRRATQSNDERIRLKMGADSTIETVDGRAKKGAEASVGMLVTCPCLL
jgi:hypothetical protein